MSLSKTTALYTGSEDSSVSITFNSLKYKTGADALSTAFKITSIPEGIISVGGALVKYSSSSFTYSTDSGSTWLSATSVWYTSTGLSIVTSTATNTYSGTLSWTPPADKSGSTSSFMVQSATSVEGTLSGNCTITSVLTATQDAATGSVTVLGDFKEGSTLNATNDIADKDGMGMITYTWKSSNVDGSGIVTLGTGTSHILTSSEIGKKVWVEASYVDGLNTASIVASSSNIVINVNDLPIGKPTISGIVIQGQILNADATNISDADGMNSSVLAYQWQSSINGTTWNDISGAIGQTYTLAQSEVGNTVRVKVSFTDDYGTNETVYSSASSVVANINDAPTGSLNISSFSPSEGSTLTADIGNVVDLDGVSTPSYQWQSSTNGITWTNITSATNSTFTPTQSEVGVYLRVKATYTDLQGTNETVYSNQTSLVSNLNDTASGKLELTSNTPAQNSTITASIGTVADNDGLGTLNYQWQSSANGTDWSDISGATTASFSPSQIEVGNYLRAKATFTDLQGANETVYSAATSAKVSNVNDIATGTVLVSGTTTSEGTLTADTSGISDADGLDTLNYQWQSSINGTTWANISGANSSTLKLSSSETGKLVKVVVSYTDALGSSESLTSASTTAIVDATSAPTLTLEHQNITVVEDSGNIALGNISASAPSGTTLTSVTIGGIPAGVKLYDSSNTVVSLTNGSVTISESTSSATLNGYYLVADSNFNGNVNIILSSTASNGVTGSSSIPVSITPVSDAATLNAGADVTGNEDTVIALSDILVSKGVSSETLIVTIEDIPAGTVLKSGSTVIGITNGIADVTSYLSSGKISGLTVTPLTNSDADFTLTVKAIEKDGSASANIVTDTILVTVNAVTDTPTFSLSGTTASGNEDTVITLPSINAILGDTDGSETLTVTISGIPTGAVLKSATDTITVTDGVATLSQSQYSNITITAPSNSDVDFTLTYSAAAKDGAATASTPITHSVAVTVNAVSDTPTLTVGTGTASGAEDAFITLPTLTPALTDSSETLSVALSGIPTGSSLKDSGGTAITITNGTALIASDKYAGLQFKAPSNYSGSVSLTVTAISTDGTAPSASVSQNITVTVTPVADAPTLAISSLTASGNEDTVISLPAITSALLVDSSETLTVTISGIPAGAVLKSGATTITVTDGVATLTASEYTGLTLTPAANYNVIDNGPITLTYSAKSTESNDTSATTTATATITVNAVNDAPTIGSIVPTNPVLENATATAIDSDVSFADVDSADLNGGKITISGLDSQDVVSIINDSLVRLNGANVEYFDASWTTVGTVAGGTGTNFVITMNASATPAIADKIIEHISFYNNDDTPTTSRNLSITITDGDGGTATSLVAMNVTAVNDAPTFTTLTSNVDTTVENTQVEITFTEIATQANEGDVDGTVIGFVVKAVTSGTLLIGIDLSSATAWEVGINDLINSTHQVFWTPSNNSNGSLEAFTVVAKDDLGEVSATAIPVLVTVTSVNDAPTITIPETSYSMDEDGQAISLRGLSITDLDSASGDITVVLSVSHGILSVDDSILTIGVNPSSSVTLTGTLAQINATLALTDAVMFSPVENYNGTDTLTISVNDGGNTGFGGAKTDSKTVSITINAVNDVASIGGEDVGAISAGGTTDTGTLTITDVDAGEAVFKSQTNTSGSYGTFAITAGGVWTYTINNANTVVSKLPTNATITDTFTVKSADDTSHSVLVTITGTNNGTLTVAESEAVQGATGLNLNGATYAVEDSAAHLSSATNITLSKTDITLVTANTAATIEQAVAIEALTTDVVYSVSDVAANIGEDATGLDEAVNVTITNDVTVAKATIIESATNSGTKSVATITDSAALISASSDAVLGNSAGLVTANTAATIEQATLIDAFEQAVVFAVSDTAALIAAASDLVLDEATLVTANTAATIEQAVAIEALTTDVVYSVTGNNNDYFAGDDALDGNANAVTDAVSVTITQSINVAQALAIKTARGDLNEVTYTISDTSENILLASSDIIQLAGTVTVTDTNNFDNNTQVGDIYNFNFTTEATVNLENGEVGIITDGIKASDIDLLIDFGDNIIISKDDMFLIISSNTALNVLNGSETIFSDGSLLKMGDSGANTIYGSNLVTAADYLLGGEGNDILRGLAGNDKLEGAIGNDIIYGGLGSDTINGGLGNDLIYGGNNSLNDNGADIFQYLLADQDEGDDIIIGFQGSDKIQVDSLTDITGFVKSGTNTVLTIGENTTVTLSGFTLVNDIDSFKTSYVVETQVI